MNVKEHFWKPKVPYKDVELFHKNSDSSVHLWEFKWDSDSSPNKKLVIFCHGNSGNISHREYIIEICRRKNLNLIVFDYRGYGKSKGNPTQEGIFPDGQLVYDYAVHNCGYKGEDIVLWGESLGGSVVAYLGGRNVCSSVILMSTFSGLDDIIRYSNTCGNDFTRSCIAVGVGCFCDVMPSRNRVKDIKCPAAVVHSIEDDFIPIRNAEILYENIPHDNKIFIRIKGGHASPNLNKTNLEEIYDFIINGKKDLDVNSLPSSEDAGWVSSPETGTLKIIRREAHCDSDDDFYSHKDIFDKLRGVKELDDLISKEEDG